MIDIIDKKNCCGCGACKSICPKQCIEMKSDFEGFLYPEVDKNICIDCGLCEKVCPIKNKPTAFDGECHSYVLRTKNNDILKDSTSGGFFSDLTKAYIESGDVVWAVTYDNDHRIVHAMVENSDDDTLSNFRGSKYVQSDMTGVFEQVETQLKNNRKVCFFGTICQIAGLKKYLGKEFENLITVDLICHGVPSPMLWDKYVKYQENKYKSKIKKVLFRNKTYGYHSGTMKIEFENGKTYYGSARVDYMLKSFFSEISSRPSCYSCAFKQLERCSDISIYDCWHAKDLVKGLKDDDMGFTNVIVRSKNGLDLMKQISDKYEMYDVDTERAIECDGSMVRNSAIPNPKRDDYYKDLLTEDLRTHINRFIPVTYKDIFIEKSKGLLYRMNLIELMRDLKAKFGK